MLTAQKRKSRKITSVKRTDDSLIMHSGYGTFKLSPKNEHIIRISFARSIDTHEPEPATNDVISETGIGIVYDGGYSSWEHIESENNITLKTSAVTLEIAKDTASISYYDSNNMLLLAERSGESRSMDEYDSYKTVIDESTEVEVIDTADGVKRRIKSPKRILDKKLYRTRLHLDWQEGEALFGLGQGEEGVLNLRGTTRYAHQGNMKIAVPFLLSSMGYGILLSTGSPVIFNDTEFGSYLYTEADVQMDYYFIAGGSFDNIIKGYRLLTGKAAMLPKWAFGYIQSQERYETADELIATVKEYRRRNIGLDCIVLDWMSWPEGLWGQKSFDEKRFPDPSAMMDEIHSLNTKMMISIWPSMDEKGDNAKEFAGKNLMLPASNVYDAFNEEARRLYWKQAFDGLYAHNIDAWWCDSSEPFTPEWSDNVRPEASILYCRYLEETYSFMPPEKSNAYGLVHAQGIYEGQRSVTEDKRVANLTRSGYTGQQKYGTILWSGDISASWDVFRRQIADGLNFCASGLPYWTLDIGGFFVKQGTPWYWSGEYEKGTEDLGYRELYTRWFQYGAFLPVFRAHGTDIRREIWNFGEPGEMFYDALVKAVDLRYSLMPYIYSLAAAAWYDDSTIMRMLAFDYPDDKQALDVSDQYMFGRSIMVCPVTEPMYYGVDSKPLDCSERSRVVYLPGGTRWYDYWTNKRYDGGQRVTVRADISEIPLFVREGSIIPMTKPMNFTGEDASAPVELKIYPGCDGEFLQYDDDGDGYMYEKGAYALTRISWSDNKGEVNFETLNSYPKAKTYEYIICIQKEV